MPKYVVNAAKKIKLSKMSGTRGKKPMWNAFIFHILNRLSGIKQTKPKCKQWVYIYEHLLKPFPFYTDAMLKLWKA